MSIAEALRGVGDYAEAADHAERAFRLRQAHQRPGHPDTIDSLRLFAVACRDARWFGPALEAHAQIVALERSLPGFQPAILADDLDQYGVTCQRAGRLDLAAGCFRDAYKIGSGHGLPPGNPLAHLARNLLLQGKPAEAEPAAREALAYFESAKPGNWTCYVAMSLLGDSLLGQHNHEAAGPLLLKGYEGLKCYEAQLDAHSTWRLDEAVDRLSRFYEATNQPRRAAELRHQHAVLRPPAS
jgi:tetratricopeptide (TPR) repeat protein